MVSSNRLAILEGLVHKLNFNAILSPIILLLSGRGSGGFARGYRARRRNSCANVIHTFLADDRTHDGLLLSRKVDFLSS